MTKTSPPSLRAGKAGAAIRAEGGRQETGTNITIRSFPTPNNLAESLADYTATAIACRLAKTGKAAIAVSGGATPIAFFQALSIKPLDWKSVTITLVDDRWVAETSPRSNAALVRHHLLQGPAAAATFLLLVNDAATPEAGRTTTEAAIAALPLPFAAVILGMGNDGHTASFFPGGDRLSDVLTPADGQRVESMRAAAAGEPRITLTLPVLLAADALALHIEGAGKRLALDAALAGGAVPQMPIRAVLARTPPPAIFWSP